MKRIAWPIGLERWWVAGAGLVWIGVAAGRSIGAIAPAVGLLAALAAAAVHARTPVVLGAVVVALGGGAGWVDTVRTDRSMATPPGGEVTVFVDAVTDDRRTPYGSWVLVRPVAIEVEGRVTAWRGPPGLLSFGDERAVPVGSRLAVSGPLVARPGRAAGDGYAWRMRPDEVVEVPVKPGWLVTAADRVRSRIAGSLSASPSRSAAALVSGFLIGDVRELDPVDGQAMRAAGLSHFVAVSGSNVALFLLAWWVVIAPLARSPLGRAVGGIVGLALFGTITRWEPSVVRAAAMAAGVLAGRAAGLPITAWTALGGATALVLVVVPGFAADVGFQLSVAATAGVLAGSRMLDGFGPRWISLPLGVTLAAQVAVAPVLLTVFGTVPIWSPLANLLAAPLVTASTVLGGLGALGVPAATGLAIGAAEVVLRIAHAVAGLPTVGWAGVLAIAVCVGVAVRWRRSRPALALVGAVAIAAGLWPAAAISGPVVVALDVGQGDAILLVGEGGGVVLVDGGPDPSAIVAALARHGIRRIDLAVATHPDEDHIGGIIEVVGRIPVGRLWRSDPAGGHPRIDDLVAVAAGRGVPMDVPEVGWVVEVGGVRLTVLGPLRRYAASNDESIVMIAEVGGLSVYLTADTEGHAQRDLGMPSVDVLKVPHHGSATTDLDWLATTDARLAIISVGDNDFGHPRPEVLEVLERRGVTVRRTDLEGDVEVRP